MSDDNPIGRSSALGELLDADRVPALSGGFADRVVGATSTRAAPLPELRRSKAGAGRRQNLRRFGMAAIAAGALASAAAATGLLDDLPIALPSPGKVWDTLTGQTPEPLATQGANQPSIRAPASASIEPDGEETVAIEGPIDTPEELDEAFRRVDNVRDERKTTRRGNVDRRIEETLERRREQGLPAPTPEGEARLRNRLEQMRERRDQQSVQRIKERRAELRKKIEEGGELTRDELIAAERAAGQSPEVQDRLQRLRELPPEERRARLRQWRENRQQRREERRQGLQQSPAQETEPPEPEPAELEAPLDAPEDPQTLDEPSPPPK
ncbi:MAG: hypothetical protein AAF127_16740 [Pseudomonadota bacterium]